MKLTYEKSKDRFASTGQCNHDPDYFEDVRIPNSDTNLTNCGICQDQIMKWYGTIGLGPRILNFLTVSKTRSQIYFRFKEYSKNTIRGRLSDLKRKNKIFSLELDVFTPVEMEKIPA